MAPRPSRAPRPRFRFRSARPAAPVASPRVATMLLALSGVLLAPAAGRAEGPPPPLPAPPAFLTDVEGPEALSWVRARNEQTFSVLEHDPRYAGFHADALRIAQSHDRIPAPETLRGQVFNLWQDAAHPHGIWRRTSPAAFRSPAPDWHTVIDLDALSAAEHVNWVWKGITCLEPAEDRCLVLLSDAGEDATTAREFDLGNERFVPNGFRLPRSKQEIAWEDADTLLVSRDWTASDGAGKDGAASSPDLTASGYPFIVKRVRRGQPLAAAAEVARGTRSDVSDGPESFTDGSNHRAILIRRGVSFFADEYRLVTPHGLVLLPLPPKSDVVGLVAGRLIAKLNEDWHPASGAAIPAGSLAALPLDRPDAAPELVFAPGPRQSVDAEAVATTRNRVVAAVFDNVRGQGWSFAPPAAAGGRWTGTRLPLPDNVAVKLADAGPHSDGFFLQIAGFLTPSQLWQADAVAGTASVVKSLPAQFDATGLVVEQLEATSKDGTRIPYFIVHRRDMKHDGNNPTELTAYGGFGVSSVPSYTGAIGKLWLARGGVYVLANIRGGGEFGPAWHEAGRKTQRQRVFDDFAAVGQDLISRHITSTRRLGIRGRSNGGLLMGVEFTQHPDLWRAVIIGVPLLDMEHFESMAAGASWVDEYGSMSRPEEAAFLRGISPLANLRAGVRYPEPFIFTSTKDDRVGPVHARRFAWTLQQLKQPFFYYEDTEGGHAGTANLPEIAHEQALEATYLTRVLMD
ncbi:prolyl oligopeptidase family serine peptidase [Rhizosaccharibacter radicis]|uniref:Prolyl oligopeptidase family serine peptidase n=1 Tax=Rhizosaccharibacter radicis TaxID=2782605 RepID=A0ABT1W100_9PROT|nr:prolyl oligopeptidase family serine peptidase [Acetobacteraceae bacterium KSS12]